MAHPSQVGGKPAKAGRRIGLVVSCQPDLQEAGNKKSHRLVIKLDGGAGTEKRPRPHPITPMRRTQMIFSRGQADCLEWQKAANCMGMSRLALATARFPWPQAADAADAGGASAQRRVARAMPADEIVGAAASRANGLQKTDPRYRLGQPRRITPMIKLTNRVRERPGVGDSPCGKRSHRP